VATAENQSFVGRTRDISEHGVLLETPEPLPPGTEVLLSLFDEQTGQAIELPGLVARLVPAAGPTPAAIGVKLVGGSPAWSALVARAHAEREGRTTSERPVRRLRVLVVADDIARRGAVALYVTSGWDVRFASDLASTEEALQGLRIDAVIAEHDLHDPRWSQVLEAAQRTQPHARRIVRAALAGELPPPPGKQGDLVHRVVDLEAGLEAVLDALAADWGAEPGPAPR
jgi:hypothetical protein